MSRRRQLLGMRTAESNRLGATVEDDLRGEIREHMRWLDKRLAALDRDLRMTCGPVLCGGRRRISCAAYLALDRCSA